MTTATTLTSAELEHGAAWLRSAFIGKGSFELRSGTSVRIAALTEGDLIAARQRVRNGDESVVGSRLRRELVAASVNRAYGCGPADTGYVQPAHLAGRPVGELASLLAAILRLSGLEADHEIALIGDLLPGAQGQ